LGRSGLDRADAEVTRISGSRSIVQRDPKFDAYLVLTLRLSQKERLVGKLLKIMAHPTRCECMTFAFGGQIRSPLYSALALATVRFPQQPIDSLTGI
jgi:hypothetical protein